jgi:hypothetical protein
MAFDVSRLERIEQIVIRQERIEQIVIRQEISETKLTIISVSVDKKDDNLRDFLCPNYFSEFRQERQ